MHIFCLSKLALLDYFTKKRFLGTYYITINKKNHIHQVSNTKTYINSSKLLYTIWFLVRHDITTSEVGDFVLEKYLLLELNLHLDFWMQSLMEAQTRPCLHFVHSSSSLDLVNNPKPLQLVRQQHFQFAGTCPHQPFIKSELWKAYDPNQFRWHGQHFYNNYTSLLLAQRTCNHLENLELWHTP